MGIQCQKCCKANQVTEIPHLGAAIGMWETSQLQRRGPLCDLAIQSDQMKHFHLNLKQRFLEKQGENSATYN